ncbi:MAG: hypothetical protein RIB67_07480 [Miltoncostaeaceae bacterium]
MQPLEVVGAPYTIYIAAAGTAFPAIDEDPAVDWSLLGTSGTRSMGDGGVTINHEQDISPWTPAGATGPVKAFRTSESLTITGEIADVSLEQYRELLNRNAVETTAPGAGAAGFRAMGLSRGLVITELSLLVRGEGLSPYGLTFNAQYEVPRCYEGGSPSVQFQKGEPAMLAFEFVAMEDLDAASEDERFGRLIVQDEEPAA